MAKDRRPRAAPAKPNALVDISLLRSVTWEKTYALDVDGTRLGPDAGPWHVVRTVHVRRSTLLEALGEATTAAPIPMVLHCPACGFQHVDAPEPERGWGNPPHKSHLCHHCGAVWRPADVPTVGVQEIATKGAADTLPPSLLPEEDEEDGDASRP